MGIKAIVKDRVTPLWRVNPKTGYPESVHFQGDLRSKPKGWKIGRQKR